MVFDAPATEFHSAALNPFGITIWHGQQRYRFAIGHVDRPLAALTSIVGVNLAK